MFRFITNLRSRFRVFADSGWQDDAPLRWAAQLLVGGLPGVLVCLVIRWMAGAPAEQGSGAHIASIMPLLSASGLQDSAAFHRLQYETPAGAIGQGTPQFRMPSSAAVDSGKVAAAAQSKALPTVDFNAPRTAWKHLGPAVRARIDASLALRHDWQRIVLHGSRASHGNARLLDRYDTNVRGLSQGLAYHFVIGNGSGAADGSVETGVRWTQAMAAGDATDTGISVCLVGDFNSQAPSTAQLEAVNELKDYLTIKLGRMALSTHQESSCLGVKFPEIDGLATP
ncbi:MAG: N-acetylmuramoyl-L-alanine amidase [Verrucomicrobiaceae bacterium]|nr:N-acetylmuramoyl-L-alanine amidase [Verrucomicrobiaceae bacterium]